MGRRLDARGGEEEGGSGGGDTPFARSAVAKQSTAPRSTVSVWRIGVCDLKGARGQRGFSFSGAFNKEA